MRLALVRAGLSWSEAGELDMPAAALVLELASGKRTSDTTTYVSTRRRKRRAPAKPKH